MTSHAGSDSRGTSLPADAGRGPGMSFPDGHTRLAALFGHPIEHSISPSLHSESFRKGGINAIYLALSSTSEADFHALAAALMRSPHFIGGNITIPYKRAALALPEVLLTERVMSCAAANTLWRDEAGHGAWTLENTDVDGVAASLELLERARHPCHFVVLGAGGAASAALQALRERAARGASTTISCVVRDVLKATRALKNFLDSGLPLNILEHSTDALMTDLRDHARPMGGAILINTLPLGHAGEINPWAVEALDAALALSVPIGCFDMIYRDTPLVAHARASGFEALNGRVMLETQARAAFRLWAGQLP